MTITTELDALLDAILREPADDGLRLIYADWLADHGQEERGEFIRVQCEIDRHPHGRAEGYDTRDGVDPEYERLFRCHRRERELLQHLSGDNLPLPGCILSYTTWGESVLFSVAGVRQEILYRPVFRRGFIDEVSLPLRAFHDHAKTLFAAQPVTRVVLTDAITGAVNQAGSFAVWRHVVGRELWDILCPVSLSMNEYVETRNREKLELALSVACVLHGRQLAGLEEIP